MHHLIVQKCAMLTLHETSWKSVLQIITTLSYLNCIIRLCVTSPSSLYLRGYLCVNSKPHLLQWTQFITELVLPVASLPQHYSD